MTEKHLTYVIHGCERETEEWCSEVLGRYGQGRVAVLPERHQHENVTYTLYYIIPIIAIAHL